jgi:hypothetical protein
VPRFSGAIYQALESIMKMTMSPAAFLRRRMDLFNKFHRLRRFADDIDFHEFELMEGIINCCSKSTAARRWRCALNC